MCVCAHISSFDKFDMMIKQSGKRKTMKDRSQGVDFRSENEPVMVFYI
jgi:hypothetical protein